MAVKDDDVYHPTEGLILPHSRRHYRVTVVPAHWQLRSLVGCESDVVYFPTGPLNQNIMKLNTVTKECKLIKRLKFEPRCLVVENGWLCCGGETGDFTAIRLGDSDSPDPTSVVEMLSSLRSDPIAIDAAGPEDAPVLPRMRPRRSPDTAEERKKTKIGTERVNCITLWFPPTLTQPFESAYREAVAVLANNDKTVTVVSVRNELALDELFYPDCVNRAVMSPDGRLLVAVSDDPYLYVHERDRASYEWKECRRIHLKGQIMDDRSDNRGSFAACFSSTGHLLAVGTQYGTISIFNVGALTDADVDPLVTCFKSSRSNAEVGAVRDMAFAPGAVDLLAWSEDRGNVGVADVRSAFTSRQILYLDRADGYDHIDISPTKNTPSSSALSTSFIDPRLLERQSDTHDALSSSFAATLDLTLEHRNQTRELLDRYSSQLNNSATPLTTEETRVLEALQEHRRRREQRAVTRANQLAGIAWPETGSRSTLLSDNPRPRDRSASGARFVRDMLVSVRDQLRTAEEQTMGSPRNVRDILGTVRDQLRTTEERLQGLQASMRATSADRREQGEPEGRRAAVALPPPRRAGAAERETTDRSPSRRASTSSLFRMPTVSASPPPVSGWPEPPPPEFGSPTIGRPLLRDLWDDSDYRLRRISQIRDYQLSHLSSRYPSMLRERSDPHDTAGLAWSDDGQVLFVGAVNGIYEFHVDAFRRKIFSSITSR